MLAAPPALDPQDSPEVAELKRQLQAAHQQRQAAERQLQAAHQKLQWAELKIQLLEEKLRLGAAAQVRPGRRAAELSATGPAGAGAGGQ